MIIILRNYKGVIVFLVLFAIFAGAFVALPQSHFFYVWFGRVGPIFGIALTIAAFMYSFRNRP